MRVKFTETFNYRWPSRSMTQWEPGEYTVKREAGEAAVKAGKAVEIKDAVRVDIKDEK